MGGGDTSQTTTAVPWSGVQPYLTDAYTQLSQVAQNTPSYYPGSTVAGQSGATQQGIGSLLSGANNQQQIADTTQQNYNFLTGDAMNPDSNPYLQQTAQAAIKPIMDQLTQVTLPGIDRGAVQAGGFGGTAQTKLDLQAIDQANQRALDTTAGIYSTAYQQGQQTAADLTKASPLIASNFSTPGQTALTAGNVTDTYQQNLINEDVNRYNFNQTAPMDWLTQYISTLQGMPSGTSTTMTGTGSGGFNGALSGAVGGIALNSMMPALAASNPWLLPLMLGGSGFLSNR